MNFKKLFIGGIVGGVVFFLLGWLIYGIMLMDFMSSHTALPAPIGVSRPMPMFPYLILGNILSGFLLAYIFLKANVNSLMGGLTLAAVVGLLISSSYDSIMYATTYLASRTAVLADVVAFTVMCAVSGAVIGFTFSKVK
ncbi:hypothetical protein LK994_13100 [Ferruginibacter lapsinanis]|uniref:hypothetical protein n=1 Tax=Ferruginibacter lapsinanis TaxID=563172 RepID=UPI001E2F225B|nr:hypothetical protein [Ferruginibacter lapsinanis]UEG49572.1 hypothetical protein LK994_13100 [Ferruginibacter lapsinanis]